MPTCYAHRNMGRRASARNVRTHSDAHSTVRMAEEYTKIQLTRQEELTRLIQERLASVGEKQTAVVQ